MAWATREPQLGSRSTVWLSLPGHCLRLYFVTRACVPKPDEVDGGGPDAINSDSYVTAGAGVKIGIIDSGFVGFSAARDSGDAPSASMTSVRNLTTSGFESGEDTHGTGCIEAAYDHCDGATWRLYKINELDDMDDVVADAIANGVNILSHSLSFYNQGWDDDTGDACTAANEAAEAGILFFTSAGNRAKQHWKGGFNPGLHDTSWHDWDANGNETIEIAMPGSSEGEFYLCWDRTGGPHDFDFYLYNDHQDSVIVSSTSVGNQYEEFTWENTTANEVTVNLAVWRASGDITDIEVFLHGSGTWELDHIRRSSSTTSPSNSTHPNVISNGAVRHTDFDSASGDTGIIRSYSSRGPSNSGMQLPDVCGPTNTRGTTYSDANGFGGTSCATPNNAGAACAFWSADPLLSADAVRWLMFEKTAMWRDWGVAGGDDIYGLGGTILLDYVPNTLWVAKAFGNTANDRDGPFHTIQGAHDAASSGARLLVFPGGSYPEPAMLTKPIKVETVENSAFLGG